MRIVKFNHLYLVLIFLTVISCNRQIKKIEYYAFSGKVDSNRAEEIFKTKSGLYKVEIYDTSGNLIRENGFDYEMNEDNVIERKYDENHNLVEVLTYKRYSNQVLSKTYLWKYIYKDNLLVEILSYYGTFDSSGFWARNTFIYNNKKQKIKEEFISYNDEAIKETRLYDWKDEFSYVEDRIDKEGLLAERHFVRLDKNGKEIEHRINFGVNSKDENSYQVYFENSYDEYGNVLINKSKYVGSPEQKLEYEYLYVRKNWNYRLQNSDNNYSTEFRKIDYY